MRTLYIKLRNPLADLRNTDLNSEMFMKKLHRAQEALSQSGESETNSIKTLSASFGTKWPYKRTMSAPASMLPRQDTKQGTRFTNFRENFYSNSYHTIIND